MSIHDEETEQDVSNMPVGPPKPRVGYGSPPVAHQFKPGKSGNPRGRPKNSTSASHIAARVLLESHDLVEGDRKVRRTTLDLLLLALRNKAFEGNPRAFRELEKLAAKFHLEPPKKPPGFLVVPGRLTMESWRELYEDKRDPTQPRNEDDE